MRNQAFLMNLDTLEEFYIRCGQRKAVTLDERNAVLLELMSECKIKYLGHTEKTCPELATEMIKNGVRAKSYVKGKKK